MTEIVSLEASLTDKYEHMKLDGLDLVSFAEENLARVALIYSGQLTLDVLNDDLRENGN